MSMIDHEEAAQLLRSVGYTVQVKNDLLHCTDEIIFFTLPITDGCVPEERFRFYYRLGVTFN